MTFREVETGRFIIDGRQLSVRESIAHMQKLARLRGQEVTWAQAKYMYRDHCKDRTFVNERYTVCLREYEAADARPPITHLSIKRNDKEPLHDWRDLQAIKNALCGPEREGVELYPAESRVVDTANQYHLWVLAEGFVMPFGFADGMKSDAQGNGAKQRPFTTEGR